MQWVNVIGITSFIQVGLAMGVYTAVMGTPLIPQEFSSIWPMIGSSLVMGVLVLWVAMHLWNMASRHIPIVFASV